LISLLYPASLLQANVSAFLFSENFPHIFAIPPLPLSFPLFYDSHLPQVLCVSHNTAPPPRVPPPSLSHSITRRTSWTLILADESVTVNICSPPPLFLFPFLWVSGAVTFPGTCRAPTPLPPLLLSSHFIGSASRPEPCRVETSLPRLKGVFFRQLYFFDYRVTRHPPSGTATADEGFFILSHKRSVFVAPPKLHG